MKDTNQPFGRWETVAVYDRYIQIDKCNAGIYVLTDVVNESMRTSVQIVNYKNLFLSVMRIQP